MMPSTPPAGTPTPLYYGLLLAHTMMRLGTFDAVTLSTTHNLDAYAVQVSDGSLRVIVVNKDSTDASAQINLPTTFISGFLLHAGRGGTGRDQRHYTDGRGVSSGTWSATNPITITVDSNTLTLTIPAGTALALTLTP